MATKRADSNAVQIRLTDAELIDLDAWVESLQSSRVGGSGVSRASIIRDLIVVEMRRRLETLDAVLTAKYELRTLLAIVAWKRSGKKVPPDPFDPDGSISLLRAIVGSRLPCVPDATRLLDVSLARSQERQPDGSAAIDVQETIRILTQFVHEAESLYGEAIEHQGELPDASCERPVVANCREFKAPHGGAP